MTVTADDLRVRLQIPSDEWDGQDDAAFADAAIASAKVYVTAVAGADRVARAEDDEDDAKLAALDEATLEYAAALLSNPERVLQRRQGQDTSVSFSDSSDAAAGRKLVREILAGAFGSRAVTTIV